MAVKDRFAILEIDFIMVKGKTEPEVIYAIAGREDVAHSEGFQRLRNLPSRCWPATAAATGTARSRRSSAAARTTRHMRWKSLQSLRGPPPRYLETPPPEDWNGAFALLTK